MGGVDSRRNVAIFVEVDAGAGAEYRNAVVGDDVVLHQDRESWGADAGPGLIGVAISRDSFAFEDESGKQERGAGVAGEKHAGEDGGEILNDGVLAVQIDLIKSGESAEDGCAERGRALQLEGVEAGAGDDGAER